MMMTTIGDRAVVLGAGMAGLVSAAVLADLYEEVVVVDRDDLTHGGAPRRGAPQGRHAHALLARGQQVLEGLLPGLTGELASDGTPVGDALANARLYFSGHRLRQTDSDLVVISASRPFLEGHVRTRVHALAGVQFLTRCDVVGLTTGADGRRVTGVRLLRRADGSVEGTLAGDLVVDATGRASRATAWLQALGYRPPDEDRVGIDVAYSTRRYRLGPGALDGDLAVINGPTPENPRAGVVALLEGDVAMVTLAGVLGDRPPIDPAGFADFAASLQFPDISEAIRDAAPLDDPTPHRFPAATWRHYERCRAFPQRFVVIGDGLCCTNPIYGQGMTAAAMQAVTIGDHLRRHSADRGHRLRRALARTVAPPWQMALGADLAFPGVGRRPTTAQLLLAAHVRRVHAAGATDAKVSRSFARVAGLVDPPTRLLSPSLVIRTARHRRSAPATQTSTASRSRSAASEGGEAAVEEVDDGVDGDGVARGGPVVEAGQLDERTAGQASDQGSRRSDVEALVEQLTQTAHGRRAWVRAFNGVAGLLPRKTADVDDMLGVAERRAKVSDWGPTSFREGLELLVKAYNEDDQLHPLGRKLIYDSYVNRLVQRLQVVQAVTEQPTIAEQQVTSPVLIGGLPRTGTTLLHRVLARDPRLRGPLGWETEEPAPPPHPETADTDPRAKRFDRTWGLIYRLAPRAEAIHFKSGQLVDECYPLLKRSFTCLNQAVFVARPEYQQWLWSSTPATIDASYEFYRQQLQLLQLHYPPRRWVLKAPAHAPFLDGFARAFPDARIIYTHRDPVTLVGSVASLLTAGRSIAYRSIDPEEIGEEALDVIDAMTRRIMRARATMPASYFLDVDYDRLTHDTISVLGDIYGFLGLEFDDDMRAQAKRWVTAVNAEKRGEHRYDVRDFGLDEEVIRRRLRAYMDVSRTWT